MTAYGPAELETALEAYPLDSMPVVDAAGEALLIFAAVDGRLAAQRAPLDGGDGVELVESWGEDHARWPVRLLGLSRSSRVSGPTCWTCGSTWTDCPHEWSTTR